MRTVSLTLSFLLLAGATLAVTPAKDLYVPAVGHALGAVANGVQAYWRADIWVYNPSTTQQASVSIFLLLRGVANPNPEVRQITVNPGETRYLPDVVLNTFSAPDGTYGGLRIASSVPVAVTGRSYDANVTVVDKGQGTAGQFFSATPADAAIGPGDATDIIGLDQDGFAANGTWRSNLALVETTGNPVDLLLQRIDGSGTVQGSISYHLGGRIVNQINYVVTGIVNSIGSNQRIHVSVTGGNGAVIVAGSRLDNRTGDPSTVEMIGQGRAGSYLCVLNKTNYPTPLTLTVAGGAITAIDATIVFTDEDVPSCSDGELLRFTGPLPQPVLYDDDGSFAFSVSNPDIGGLGVTLQVSGAITVTGALSGSATVTLSGAGGCSGTKTWPLLGDRLP